MINVAQIGVGYWGPNLLRNLVANTNCRVNTVVDLSNERRRFVKNNYPAVATTDQIEDVLDDPDISAVIIATPVASHFDLTMKVLAAGKHVLVEKPMARTVEEVNKIAKLANRKSLVAMVGHTFLYNTAVRYVKQLIDSGELGEIRYIYSQRINLGRIRSDVDALWNLAPHDISIIQYWLGNPLPVSVSRRGMAYIQTDVEDVVFLNLIYPHKVMAHIHVSWLDPHKIRQMTVVGSRKMVVYDDIAENKIAIFDKGIDRKAVLGEHMDFDAPNYFQFSHRSGDVLLPKLEWQEPLLVEIDHFISCVSHGIECLTGTEHAKKVVQILSMSNKSDL